jgi:hypothetical protein
MFGLFDHLVGAGKYCRRNCEAQRLGGPEVNSKLELCRQLMSAKGQKRTYPSWVYSMTSSARVSSEGGTEIPIERAVRRFIASRI